MKLHSNWPSLLDAYIQANRASRQFHYGEWDCFQFVRGAVQAMTGEDIAAPFAPYRSRFGYLRQIRRYCDSCDLGTFFATLMKRYSICETESPLRGAPVFLQGSSAMGVMSLCGRFAWALAPTGEIVRVKADLVLASWGLRCRP